MTDPTAIRQMVHTPAELATEHVAWAEQLQNVPGVPFGIKSVDRRVIPFHPGDMVTFVARPGHGKCFARGTMVLYNNGTTRPVERVNVGDWLMGPDSLPRIVTALGRGVDELYEVVPVKGKPYVVNSDHILTLQMSGYNAYPTGTIVNLTVKEYLAKSAKFKSKAKGYRTGVDWPTQSVPIEPYYLGAWLGDGTTGNTAITSADGPIIEYLKGYAERLHMRFSVIEPKDRCSSYNIVGNKGAKNPIREGLRYLRILEEKAIPWMYKVNDRDVRLELLAGLVDTDGSYYRRNLSITQKRQELAEDIAFLCRSLGFAAYISERQCTCGNTGATGTYYRINISGDLSQIPTRLLRKQVKRRTQIKSVLRTGVTVRPVGRGDYFGFELSGQDRRFLLADFTVVHNTSILAFLARAEAKRIVARGKTDSECVVYVTWEQVTEEINAVLSASAEYTTSDIAWGRVDMDTVRKNAINRVMLPVWIVGDSLARTNSKSPRMYPEAVFSAIESIKDDFGIKPTLMLFDYIQLIPIPSQADRMKQVTEAAHRCKELAKRIGCPAAVAVQARREVDSRDSKIPGLWDAQWASSIEQTADKYFSLWRPWLTEDRDGVVDVDGTSYPVSKELLILSMQKQRFENGRWTWALHFQPQYLRLCEMEVDVMRF